MLRLTTVSIQSPKMVATNIACSIANRKMETSPQNSSTMKSTNFFLDSLHEFVELALSFVCQRIRLALPSCIRPGWSLLVSTMTSLGLSGPVDLVMNVVWIFSSMVLRLLLLLRLAAVAVITEACWRRRLLGKIVRVLWLYMLQRLMRSTTIDG